VSEPLSWDELSRAQQRALERLWARGTVRGQDPTIVIGLTLMGYVVGERLSTSGDELCSQALAEMMGRMHTTRDRERRNTRARIAAAVAATDG
jgi:hypothetical protein